MVEVVERALRSHRFRFVDERELQAGIEQVLRASGVEFVREARLGAAGTIDFLIGALGVEIKVQGALAEVTRQVHRYAQADAIDSLLVVTTRAQLKRLPTSMNGKPVRTLHLVGGAW